MNKKIFAIVLILCCFHALQAQEAVQHSLVFNTLTHDFGDFLLSDGTQHYTFTATNTSSKPIAIAAVIPSCGCTVPDWPKAPIDPGASIKLKVSFLNDQGPYPFDKSLSVYYTDAETPVILRIRGTVHEKKKSNAELFPIHFDGFRMRTTDFHMGIIAQGEAKQDSTQVINDGKNNIKISFGQASTGLMLSANPSTLKPGEKGYIYYNVDSRTAKDWGTIDFIGQVLVNGVVSKAHQVMVHADIRHNFKTYTKEELAQAPLPVLESANLGFGEVKQGEKIQKTFTLTNRGKRPMIIHKASTSQPFVSIDVPKEIPVGAKISITLTIDTKGLSGEVIAGATLVTNTPSRPVIYLLSSGTVVK
jgi:Protein of unknown function (DUF1573).